MPPVPESFSPRPVVLPFSGGRHGSAAAARRKLEELRGVLAEKFPQTRRAAPDFFSTGIAAIDEALGGGLPQAALSEVVTETPSSGGQLLVNSLLQAARRTHQYLAFIDGSDGLDPQSMEPELLPYLLWVRCRQARQALQAADLLVRDGNIPLILLDLRGNDVTELRRQPASIWFRLQRAVEQSGGLLLVLSARPQVSSAAVRVVLSRPLPFTSLEESAEAVVGQLEVTASRGKGEAAG